MIARSASSDRDERTGLTTVAGGVGCVPGVRCTGVPAGIKPNRNDVAVIVFDAPRVCASAITTNEVKAAPLLVSERHLAASGDAMRAVVCNAGNANACTGDRGEANAFAVAEHAGRTFGCAPQSVVVSSTGVIGVPFPTEKICAAVAAAGPSLASGDEAGERAARAIMTTDLVPKLSAYAFVHDGMTYTIGGMAKGSGMICPQMATMLAFVATDFALSRTALQTALRDAVEDSFNMISVDGDMSTNDSIYAFATPGTREAPEIFVRALRAVTRDLAVMMARDGEGATKLLRVDVLGARDGAQARAVAKQIVNSSLVKTAVFGADPNWGRIIAAAGQARVGIDPHVWKLALNGRPWAERGDAELLSEADASAELATGDVTLALDLELGDAVATAWGCDLTYDYVKINASYRT